MRTGRTLDQMSLSSTKAALVTPHGLSEEQPTSVPWFERSPGQDLTESEGQDADPASKAPLL